jgi:drug/metabolite transporter (DMT)-like permease
MRWLPVAIIVLSTSAADLLKSLGMRHHGEVRDFRPSALGRALLAIAQNRFVIAAVLLDIVSFLAFIALLSLAELSFAVPATAGIFVVETICARVLLRERVNWKRWIGVSFIVCGIGLLSR